MLKKKKWKANIIREYNELIFLCWIMPFIHEQKSKRNKVCLYKYIFILSQSLRCWRWITKIMSDLWCLFYMCVSLNNTKKAPTTKACSFFFIHTSNIRQHIRERGLFHYEIIYHIFHEQIFIETIIYNKWKSLLKINRRNSLLLPPFNREKKVQIMYWNRCLDSLNIGRSGRSLSKLGPISMFNSIKS